MSQNKTSQKLSIFLLKGAFNYNTYLKTNDIVGLDLKDDLFIEGKVFYVYSREKTPSWVGFLNQGTKQDLPRELKNSSSRAVLFFKTSDRVFAITFGEGYSTEQ